MTIVQNMNMANRPTTRLAALRNIQIVDVIPLKSNVRVFLNHPF